MFKRDQRTFHDNVKLGGIFVFLGGYTGILTSVILGHFVNCMSGNITETGISIGHNDIKNALTFGLVVLFFIFGAFLATKAIDNIKYGHIPVLLAESIILINIRNLFSIPALFLSSTAMGLQNGLTTYLGKVRTTHITGSSTDLGISLADKNLKHTCFNSFQIIMYFTGAILAFFFSQKFDKFAFIFAGIAILIIVIIDIINKVIKHKTLI